MRRALLPALLLVPAAALADPGDAVTGLTVSPPEVRLDDGGDRQALVVQATLEDGTTRDVTGEVELALVGSEVACVASGALLRPLQDGRATLRVSHAGHAQEVAVVVSGSGAARPIRFETDVLPALTRAGCNTGSCHGTSRGKDGFHLSLFGYDPRGDYFRITREQVGRRVNLAAPEESLLLRKATGAARHTGGRRLEPGGELGALVLEWLEAGAPPDPEGLPRLSRLELRPERSVLVAGAGAGQRLGVRAVYADGSDRDVTALTSLGTSDASVARLTSDAQVVGGRAGEAWVTARFGDAVVAAQVLVVPDDPTYAWPEDEPGEHEVDRLVNAKLRLLRLAPAPLADDATFLRRLTLDVAGRLPTPAEVEAFLADAAQDKRARAVDLLLEGDDFTRLWTMMWAERLLVRSSNDRVSEKAALGYAAWLEGQLRAGAPLDRVARDLLTATGGSFEAPQVTFLDAEPDLKKLSENVAQAFLGIRLQCAQCHNHPFDRWTQDDYYGFAAFFAQLGRKNGDDPRERVLFDRRRGEVTHPVTGKPVPPRFLGGPSPEVKEGDRRQALAEWLTAPGNPWFARNVANLLWAHLLGAGIVHEPDDARVGNPPSDPALLDALAERLRATGYDAKGLVRLICTSRAYQRATVDEGGGLAERNYARAQVRRLRAEVLLDAIAQATDAPDDFKGLPRGGRAVAIPDGATTSDFLTTFGRATREGPCTCEVRVAPNLGQALHLLNGDTVNARLRQGRVVPRLLEETGDPLRVVALLYLRTLSRPPTAEEVDALREPLAASADPAPLLEDLLWALLNSREFVFNH